MSWIDLHEGILEEFSDRASFDDNEFLRGNGVQTFESNGTRSNRSTVCVVCEAPVERKSLTCSKRCTQAHRRAELIADGVCTKCKINKAKKNAKECATCSPPAARDFTAFATGMIGTSKSEEHKARIAESVKASWARRKVLNCPDKSRTLART